MLNKQEPKKRDLTTKKMQDRANNMQNFYEFIGISENEYQDMIDSEIIPNKLLVQTFEPYKYPASLFRGDNPTELDVCNDIMEHYNTYQYGKKHLK